ncbi:DUF1553 domain-containing protein [Bryobacter aggregatus]|uniref:DUF1553 domain-containing protein n=1 Tax=Bryobacter aggregatus TaxID=360054 RepID=UPI001EE30B7E|nr:DUF1553 domain-containing protein [Bryobacter aggregatus]
MRLLLVLAISTLSFGAAPIEFNRDVRPILSDKCLACHGADAKNKGIPLRLDIEAQAKADLGGHRAIVPGNPEASELVKRINTDSKARKMPPIFTGHVLTQAERDTLTQWIAQGAQWQKHWSFIPPVRPALPKVSDEKWARNPIDNFILAKLDREGLKPSPEASKDRLIRRVTLDLTGVPPTPAEVDTFLKDKSPDAYDKVVQRLLANPKYGERLAMRWLDNARYADSNGYQYDGERQMWRWRDYVIESFNKNKPFNDFITEQIAGDLLPNATMEQKMGTGFNRNHRANTEFGIVAEEYAVEYVIDRVETNSAVFLGLTMGCARCHNHKYDPTTQKEMYQFYAYFNNVPEHGRAMKYGNSPPLIAAPTQDQQAKLAQLDQSIEQARKALRVSATQQQSWQTSLLKQPEQHWVPAVDLKRKLSFEDPEQTRANAGIVRFVPGRIGKAVELDGTNYLDAGFEAANFDIEERFTIATWVYSDKLPNGTLFSRMNDRLKGRGYGLEAREGKIHVHFTSEFADDAIRMDSEAVLQPKTWQHVTLTYNGSRMADGIKVYVDGKPVPLKIEIDAIYRPFNNAAKQFPEPFRIGAGGGPTKRFAGRFDELGVWSRVLSTEDIAVLAEGKSLQQLAQDPSSPHAKRVLRAAYLEAGAPQPQRELWARIQQLEHDRELFEFELPTVMVMAEMPVRRDTFILQRGEYDKPGEKVEPGVPSFLPPLPAGAPNNRLGLAQWMTAKDHPLTARVNINRFWQAIFGTGIVKTTEDFGNQGEWPSHPELLDWLATEFVESKWDLKHMMQLMVTSAAYRQDSRTTPDLTQRDPENRWLAHGPRLRLPAEAIRDQALYAAGLLNPKLGGRSTKSYQPAGLWEEQSMQNMDYEQDHGADLYRRSLYMYWKRTIAPPMMVTFDASTRESCTVRESRSNTPLQALNLMNDVTFLEAGRQIGRRMIAEGGATDEARLSYGMKLLLSRTPTPKELSILKSNLNYHRDYFASNPGRVDTYLSKGESPVSKTIPPQEQAAYMAVGNLILNLDEAVTKD